MQIPVHKINDKPLFIKWRDIRISKDYTETAHRHDYYQFMVLKKVKGVHEIDFENYKSKNYSLHFIGKDRVHKVDFDPSVEGGAFLFSEGIFDASDADRKLLSSFSYFKTESYPVLTLNKKEFDEINILVQQTKNALANNNFDSGKYLLFALLSEVREKYNLQSKNDAGKKSSNEIILLNNFLQQNAKSVNDLDIFLKENGITTARINHLCKQEYGKTALQLLHERKLLEIKRLLVYTDMQIKEIAYECGFEDVAYFNRYFKKYTEHTPNTFRKNH